MKKAIFILAALVFVFYAKTIFAPSQNCLSYDTDIKLQYYGLRHYGYEALKSGRIPLWTKDNACGTPFLANIQTALFYPPNAVFFWKNTARAFNWNFLIHSLLAGLGVLLFLKELKLPPVSLICGSAVYIFCAPYLNQIWGGHITLVNTITWAGFVFWSIQRLYNYRKLIDLLALGVFVCLAFLASLIQDVFYLMIAAGLYTCVLFCRRVFAEKKPEEGLVFVGMCAGAILFGAGLSSVQLLPTLELSGLSTRVNMSYDFCRSFAFPPENFLTYFMPEFFGSEAFFFFWGKYNFCEMCAYAGVVSLGLSFFALSGVKSGGRRTELFFFISLAVLSFVMAIGDATPLFKFLYRNVPGFDFFRGSSKFIFLSAFSISVLAAFGAERLSSADFNISKPRTWFLIAAGLAAFGFYCFFSVLGNNGLIEWEKFFKWVTRGYISLNIHSPGEYAAMMKNTFSNAHRQFLRFLIILGAFCALIFVRNAKVRMPLIAALLIIDLWSYGSKFMIASDASGYGFNRDTADFLNKDPKPFRIATPVDPANLGGPTQKLENISIYDPIILKDYYEYIVFSQGDLKDKFPACLVPIPIYNFNKFFVPLNLRYLVLPANLPQKTDSVKFERVHQNSEHLVIRMNAALNRAFFVNRITVLPHERILEEIGRNDFNPAETAVVEEAPPFPTDPGKKPAAEIKFLTYDPEKVVIEADTDADGLLVLSDSYYPGWKASVNGKKEKIYRTDHFLRGVFLKAGKNTVEFAYTCRPLFYGAIISLIFLTLLAVLGTAAVRREMKARGALSPPRMTLNASGLKKNADDLFDRIRKHRTAVTLGAALIMTFIAFSPCLKNGFTNCDDDRMLTQNEKIRSLSWGSVKKMFAEPHDTIYQPLVLLSYAVEYRFSRLDPASYHATNLALHLINTALVFLIIIKLCGALPVAFITALLFGIHPMHVESVAWVSERKDVLVTMFYLGSVAAYIFYGDDLSRKWYYRSLALFVLALFSKPLALSLPAVLILIDFARRKKVSAAMFTEKIPFFALAAVFCYIAHFAKCSAQDAFPEQTLSIAHKFFAACYVIVFYLKKLFMPVNLTCYYQYPDGVSGHLPAAFLIAPAVVAGLCALPFFMRRNRRETAFGIIFFLVTVSVTVVQIMFANGKTTPADRYTYIPYIGLFYAAASIGYGYWNARQTRSSGSLIALILSFALAACALGLMTWNRCQVWKDSVTLWSDVLKHYPGNYVALMDRSAGYNENKEFDKAADDLTAALKVRPDSAIAWFNRGSNYLASGRYNNAVADLGKALSLKKDMAAAYFFRGDAYMAIRDFNRAISDYTNFLRLAPGSAAAFFKRGDARKWKGDLEKAVGDYDKALAIDPYFALAYFNKAVIYYQTGRFAEAWADIQILQGLGHKVDPELVRRVRQALDRGGK